MSFPRADLDPTARLAELRDLAHRYRALGGPPPDIDFAGAGGAGCPICHTPLQRAAAGWDCPPCTAGWNWSGTRGAWTPEPAVARARPARQPATRLARRWAHTVAARAGLAGGTTA